MYKLNKKGFAVTTVVYSILVLLILFMFILLAIVRGSYFNEKDFTKEVQEELDTYLKNMGADTKKPVCTFDSSNIKLSVSQPVSVTLTCLDEAGIKEDTIDKDKFTYSNISIEEIAKGEGITDETDGTKSGYKYVIKIKGTDVGDATFTLNKSAIHDKSNNPNDSVSSSLTVTEKISKPICSFEGPSKNPITGSPATATYTLTCTGKNLEITTLTTSNFEVNGGGIKVGSVTAVTQSTTELKYTIIIFGISKGKTSTITLNAGSIKITGGDGNDAVTSNGVSYVECTTEGEIKRFDSTTICVGDSTNQASSWEYRKCTNGVWVDYEDDEHKAGNDC